MVMQQSNWYTLVNMLVFTENIRTKYPMDKWDMDVSIEYVYELFTRVLRERDDTIWEAIWIVLNRKLVMIRCPFVVAYIYCFTLLREYIRHLLYEKIIVLGVGFTSFLYLNKIVKSSILFINQQ